jgi:peptidoglycan/LPS O-acetylase OafA/YrhL
VPPYDFLHNFRWSVLPFAFGMLIPTPLGRAVTMRLPPSVLWIAIVVMIFARHLIGTHLATTANIAIASAAVVVSMLFYNKAGALGRLLSVPPTVFLGTISYSLYLLNVALLIVMSKTIGYASTIAGALIEGVVIATLTIPLAWASYRWIEQPAIAYGRSLFGSARRSPEWKPEMPR